MARLEAICKTEGLHGSRGLAVMRRLVSSGCWDSIEASKGPAVKLLASIPLPSKTILGCSEILIPLMVLVLHMPIDDWQETLGSPCAVLLISLKSWSCSPHGVAGGRTASNDLRLPRPGKPQLLERARQAS